MELPKRKGTRLKYYDYSTPGIYFITVCVKDRKELLGKIVGCGDFDTPRMELSLKGQVIKKYIEFMGNKYSHIQIDKYVIMPNHFHLLLRITDYINDRNGLLQAPSPTNNEMSKFISLLKRYCNREYGENIWQASSNDHVVRGEKDYEMIWKYIDANVIRWNEDCFYSNNIRLTNGASKLPHPTDK